MPTKYILFALLFVLASCAPAYLTKSHHYPEERGFTIDEEAQIADTVPNREVVDILLQYRNALIRKDFGSLNRLISERYFDNGGSTDTTKDDYGNAKLPELFEAIANHAESVKYDVLVKSVEIKDNRATIDYEFEFAYRYKIGDNISWDAGIDVNRLEMATENGEWKIVSGL